MYHNSVHLTLNLPPFSIASGGKPLSFRIKLIENSAQVFYGVTIYFWIFDNVPAGFSLVPPLYGGTSAGGQSVNGGWLMRGDMDVMGT